MEINQLIKVLDGVLINDNIFVSNYTHAFTSDLMSDALRWHNDNMILITGLATIQTMRTAELSGIPCVIFGRGKEVSEEMLEIAIENNIAVISTQKSLFEIAGILYSKGIKPLF